MVRMFNNATSSGGGSQTAYAKIVDQKSPNVGGGTFISGAYRTRDLNLVTNDDSSIIISLVDNQIELAPGTYRVHVIAGAFNVLHHKAKWVNVSDGIDIRGTNGYISGTSATTHSFVTGEFTITTTNKLFEVQHRCSNSVVTNGFGTVTNYDQEVYTTVQLWKVG